VHLLQKRQSALQEWKIGSKEAWKAEASCPLTLHLYSAVHAKSPPNKQPFTNLILREQGPN
jgi:hypothetical protein